MELRDYLRKEPDPADFEFSEEDYKAVLGARDSRGMQVVLKLCVGQMLALESQMWNPQMSLSEPQMEGLVQARAAYKAVIDLIMREEPEDE